MNSIRKPPRRRSFTRTTREFLASPPANHQLDQCHPINRLSFFSRTLFLFSHHVGRGKGNKMKKTLMKLFKCVSSSSNGRCRRTLLGPTSRPSKTRTNEHTSLHSTGTLPKTVGMICREMTSLYMQNRCSPLSSGLARKKMKKKREKGGHSLPVAFFPVLHPPTYSPMSGIVSFLLLSFPETGERLPIYYFLKFADLSTTVLKTCTQP